MEKQPEINTENISCRSDDYRRIEKALRYIGVHAARRPDLAEIAKSARMSEFHFQRLFKRWAGVSPKQFLQYLTLGHAKQLLAESRPLLDTAWEVGLSGPGRLHDLFVSIDAMTPGEFKQRGEGLEIAYGFHGSPFGEALFASTERGICGLSFLQKEGRKTALAELRARWPLAVFREDRRMTGAYFSRIFARRINKAAKSHRLLLAGTNFQIKVWEALLAIPEGCVTTYEDIARRIGRPGASRAVGNAVGANPVAYLIPCHRVLRSLGTFGDYRWGALRKKAMLVWESSYREERVSSPGRRGPEEPAETID